MLTQDERMEIEQALSHYLHRRSGCVTALKIVQRHRGWISEQALHDTAQFLAMTPHELESIATFYNLIFRYPVGRHVILLCDNVSCWMLGCDALRARLEQRLGVHQGQTTADGRFTLLPVPCLGACDIAPALMIDEDLHGVAATDDLDALLGRYP